MRHFLFAFLIVVSCLPVFAQPIFDYVNKPDSAFAWKFESTTPGAVVSTDTFNMTSQVWQGITWQHRLSVIRPVNPKHPDMCVLFITGGNPGGTEMLLAIQMAQALGMNFAILGDIPNQPLYGDLHEDGLIAYTFTKYMETGDTSWPLLFPMTKSAVRAMDMLQEVSEQKWGGEIKNFIVAGASKRGWTTWFTGEVDKRVCALMPMVYNNLRLADQMRAQMKQFGGFSEQIDDYTKLGLPQLLTSGEGAELAAMVDPYTYRDRAKMPKLILAGTNDRYWPVDAANLYFNDLPGRNYLIHVPNSGHGLDDLGRVFNACIGFGRGIAGDYRLPSFNWRTNETDAGLTLMARGNPAPKKINLWTASAPTRDFRDSKWTSSVVPVPTKTTLLTINQPRPATGFSAVMLEYVFDGGGREFPLTSQIYLIEAAK